MSKILAMFGYMSAQEALKNGFTHHGKYFGIPLWIAPDKDFMVATKWILLEPVITIFHYIEGFFNSVFFPDIEPCFHFLLGPRIDDPWYSKD